MTASPFADPTPAPAAGRVRMSNGRYKLPDPDTGQDTLFTRVSTIAKMLEDTYHLDQWKDRMLAKGLAMRPDLVMLAGATPLEDKRTFTDLTRSSRDTAGGSEGANHGTAFHSLTELVDRGQPTPQGTHPDNVKRLELYKQRLEEWQLQVIPGWMERVVLNREHRIVGRTDRALFAQNMSLLLNETYRLVGPEAPPPPIVPPTASIIGDVKSQKSMDFGCMAIAMQLAIYAHADLVWNEETGQWDEPDVELNQDVAVVMHVPSDRIAADIHVIDIARGWELVQMAMDIRAARKEKLNRKLEHSSGRDWKNDIMNASTKQDLSAIWKAADAAGEWTDELLKLGKARLSEIEKEVA